MLGHVTVWPDMLQPPSHAVLESHRDEVCVVHEGARLVTESWRTTHQVEVAVAVVAFDAHLSVGCTCAKVGILFMHAASSNPHIFTHHRVALRRAHRTKVFYSVIQSEDVLAMLTFEAGDALREVLFPVQTRHIVRVIVVAEVRLPGGHQERVFARLDTAREYLHQCLIPTCRDLCLRAEAVGVQLGTELLPELRPATVREIEFW